MPSEKVIRQLLRMRTIGSKAGAYASTAASDTANSTNSGTLLTSAGVEAQKQVGKRAPLGAESPELGDHRSGQGPGSPSSSAVSPRVKTAGSLQTLRSLRPAYRKAVANLRDFSKFRNDYSLARAARGPEGTRLSRRAAALQALTSEMYAPQSRAIGASINTAKRAAGIATGLHLGNKMYHATPQVGEVLQPVQQAYEDALDKELTLRRTR